MMLIDLLMTLAKPSDAKDPTRKAAPRIPIKKVA